MINNIIFWIVLVGDFLAFFIIVGAILVNKRLQIAPSSHRLGLAVIACGLLGQSYRNYVFLDTGISPTDEEIPYWVFKDIGICILAFYFGCLGIIQSLRSKQTK